MMNTCRSKCSQIILCILLVSLGHSIGYAAILADRPGVILTDLVPKPLIQIAQASSQEAGKKKIIIEEEEEEEEEPDCD